MNLARPGLVYSGMPSLRIRTASCLTIGLALATLLGHCRLPGPVSESPDPDPGPDLAAAPGRPMSAARLHLLASCMLPKLSDNWLVDGKVDNPITYNGKAIGLFLGGAQTVAYDVNFFECAGELSGTNDREANAAQRQRADQISDDDIYDADNPAPGRDAQRLPYGGYRHAIAELAGLPLYQARQPEQIAGEEANYYNPELIRWAAAYLIPDPAESLAEGLVFQTVYDRVLRRSARILVHSYVALHREGAPESITNNTEPFGYSRAAFQQHADGYRTGDFQLRYEFRDRFTGTCPDAYSNDELYFNCGHGATFWLRRALDGTDDEVWQLLTRALSRYDASFLEGLEYTPAP